MACGDRYRYLAVTASGLNLDNAYGNVPSFTDYEEWRERARQLLLLSQTFKDVLAAQEEAATPGPNRPDQFPLWDAVNEVHARAVTDYDALPSSFLNFSPAENISSAQSVVLAALCVIEMSEDAIVSLGGTAPPAPGAPPPKGNDLFKVPPWVLPVGIGVAALLLFARTRR